MIRRLCLRRGDASQGGVCLLPVQAFEPACADLPEPRPVLDLLNSLAPAA